MRLLFVRHGETDWNVSLHYQGHAPIPLNRRGTLQAAAVAERIAVLQPTALYSSDLLRAQQTAEAVAHRCGLPLVLDAGWREIDVGDWQGLTPTELEQRFPQHMAAYRRDPANTVRLNGESYAQVQQRALRTLDQLKGRHHDRQRLVVVSHGGTIRTLVCAALGLELQRFTRVNVENGSLTEFEVGDGDLKLIRLNDTAHLPHEPPAQGE